MTTPPSRITNLSHGCMSLGLIATLIFFGMGGGLPAGRSVKVGRHGRLLHHNFFGRQRSGSGRVPLIFFSRLRSVTGSGWDTKNRNANLHTLLPAMCVPFVVVSKKNVRSNTAWLKKFCPAKSKKSEMLTYTFHRAKCSVRKKPNRLADDSYFVFEAVLFAGWYQPMPCQIKTQYRQNTSVLFPVCNFFAMLFSVAGLPDPLGCPAKK